MQNRVIYGVYAVGFAKLGLSTYIPVHGLQSVGITTNFNLESVFEVGQANVYQIIEDLPDVQISLSKVLDGYPLVYHLASNGATSGSLQARGNIRSTMVMSIFNDTQDNASGTPLTQCETSGVYISSVSYTFPVDGNAMEEVSLVGNNKIYRSSAFTFAGATTNSVFTGSDAPQYGSVMRRQHFDFGTSRLPPSLPGISSSGTNNSNSDGAFNCSIQNASVSWDYGRQNINELGHRGPYFRFSDPNVEVSTSFEVVSKSGDMVSATEAGVLSNGDNLSNETIILRSLDSTMINCGTRNKMVSAGISNGGTGGDIQTLSFSYQGFNSATVTHSSDPSAL